jgi:hypothetical protein
MMQTTLGFTRFRRHDTTLPTLHQLSFAPNPDVAAREAETTRGTDVEVLDDTRDDRMKLASSSRESFMVQELGDVDMESRKSAFSRSHTDIV